MSGLSLMTGDSVVFEVGKLRMKQLDSLKVFHAMTNTCLGFRDFESRRHLPQ